MRARAVALAILLALPGAAYAQQLYRWVDKDGRVTYSQNPPAAGAAKNVQSKNLRSNAANAAIEAAGPARPAIEIKLYTNSQCGEPCRNARDLLGARRIVYEDVAVESAEALEELKKYSKTVSVPVLVLGKEVLRGFDAASYQIALDKAGFPPAAKATP